ncbi:mitochondrial inner membrane protease subunit 1 [Belonocnema kinseyi]|uniref:mitochondrial inner membrane protease subunit 1 n=1 Tax=Belonocnema kinseyi TaxID=2817044 RepID=UPI00143CC815|nr:mitochondrial inner membrane protease subunit 1 [Belonocnema kinseyi]
MARKLIKPLFSLFKSGCLTCLVLKYVGDFVMCIDSSMEPSIRSGDIILVEYITSQKRYNNGDIIITKSPDNPLFYTCKRIIGLPGDRLYRQNSLQYVPIGHCWLEGDNHESSDSHKYGPVPQGLLVGRAVCVLWPLSHISRLYKRK